MLVNKCRIYDENSRTRSAHYKSIGEKKSGSQNYGMELQVIRGNGNLQVGKRQVGKKSFLL